MTESDSDSLFVVTACYDGSPEPRVEDVYDNEDAADEHEENLKNDLSVVAWDTTEKSVKSLGPRTRKCGFCGTEYDKRDDIPVHRETCPQCDSIKKVEA